MRCTEMHRESSRVTFAATVGSRVGRRVYDARLLLATARVVQETAL